MSSPSFYRRPVAKVPYVHLECRACGWEDVVPFDASELANAIRVAHEQRCPNALKPQRDWVRPPPEPKE